MAHTQLLRIAKLKGSGIIAIAARHNLREIQSERGADCHIDPSRTQLNVILRGAGRAVDVAAEAVGLMERAKAKRRKNEVLGLEIIVSLPPALGIDEPSFFNKVVVWAEVFFEIPILSVVIHNDEAAPHCHVIMLPLFDGRMIGNGLVGNRTRLQAMQADFHAKVGQAYGLKRGTPVKRYSKVARESAADRIVTAIRRKPDSLNDPAIRDELRDAIAETMPVRLLELLGLDMPEVRTPKPKTFAGIMIQNKPERKPENAIVFQKRKNAIVFQAEISDQKEQTLSCVVFPLSTPLIQPDNAPEYTRERDSEQTGYWDELGELHKPQAKMKTVSHEVARVRNKLQAMRR